MSGGKKTNKKDMKNYVKMKLNAVKGRPLKK